MYLTPSAKLSCGILYRPTPACDIRVQKSCDVQYFLSPVEVTQ